MLLDTNATQSLYTALEENTNGNSFLYPYHIHDYSNEASVLLNITNGSFNCQKNSIIPNNYEPINFPCESIFDAIVTMEINTILQEDIENHIAISNFFYKLGKVYSQVSIDDTLDFVFKTIDKMLLDRKFILCDKLFSQIVVENFSIDILLGIATVTFPWRDKLSCRDNFIQKTKDYLIRKLPSDEAKEISYYL